MCATVTLQTTFLLTRAFFRNPEDFWLSRASNTWLIPTTLTEDGHGPRGTGLNLTHHAKLGAVSDLTGQPGRLSSISDSISDVRLLILAIPGGNRLPPPSLPRTIYAIACGVWPPFSPRLYIPYTSCPPRFRYLPPPPRDYPTVSATLPYLLRCDIPPPWHIARLSKTRIPAIHR